MYRRSLKQISSKYFYDCSKSRENRRSSVNVGPGSIYDKASYCTISQSPEPARLSVKMRTLLWNLGGDLATVLLRCLLNFKAQICHVIRYVQTKTKNCRNANVVVTGKNLEFSLPVLAVTTKLSPWQLWVFSDIYSYHSQSTPTKIHHILWWHGVVIDIHTIHSSHNH